MVHSDLVDRDDLWGFYSCRGAEVNCENKHTILHLGLDVGRLAVYKCRASGRATNAELRTDLSMRWDM
jgi:hypothetical protein